MSHSELLKIHCRICGQKRIDGGNNKGVPIKNHPQLCRWLRYLHEIELERESEEIYPTRVCEGCVNRLRNVSICQKGTVKKAMENVFELATKLHTELQDDEMRKLAREFPIADFWAHSSMGMCAICDDMQRDTFPVLDPRPALLIEVETDNGAVKIFKCERIEKRINFKRDVSSEKSKDVVEVGNDSEVKVTNEIKKPKVDSAKSPAKSSVSSSSAVSSISTPSSFQAPKISATTAWIQFNDALGRNRKSRCDKFAQLLKWSNMDNPKIITELKNSGIDFKISNNRHFTPNVEFKSTLAKCKRLLSAFPMQKRMSMMFRAITDTVTDGRTDLTDHVGIKINLNHPNLGFLVRKIKAKQAAAKAENPTRSMPSRTKSEEAKPVKNSSSINKLPSGITVSKVNKVISKRVDYLSINIFIKAYFETCFQVSRSSRSSTDSPVEVIPDKPSQSMILERPDSAAAETPVDQTVVDPTKVNKALRVCENKHLPANRQMRTDVIFDLLHVHPDSPALLSSHGIIYNPKLGKYHLQALHGQRKIHKNA